MNGIQECFRLVLSSQQWQKKILGTEIPRTLIYIYIYTHELQLACRCDFSALIISNPISFNQFYFCRSIDRPSDRLHCCSVLQPFHCSRNSVNTIVGDRSFRSKSRLKIMASSLYSGERNLSIPFSAANICRSKAKLYSI